VGPRRFRRKRAKGFEPSTFSLGIAIPRLRSHQKPPYNAANGGEGTTHRAIGAIETTESLYQVCTALRASRSPVSAQGAQPDPDTAKLAAHVVAFHLNEKLRRR
jgi:hypothetical protein